jgi:hypothetical protein
MRAALVSLLLLPLTGCATMSPKDFQDATPALVMEDYFQGETHAWGLFEDRFGKVRRQFTVAITGTWDGTVLTLDERFTYADGETDRRVWRLTKTGEKTFEGRADDVIGVARGEVEGNAFRFRYDMDLPVGGSTWRVHFDDWMFLQPGGVVLNRADVTRWGLEIGRVTLSFAKPEAITQWMTAEDARPFAAE